MATTPQASRVPPHSEVHASCLSLNLIEKFAKLSFLSRFLVRFIGFVLGVLELYTAAITRSR
eukprot:2020366-Amphidinium_carterae.1